MFWAVLWIVNLGWGCGCEGGDWVRGVRPGAAEASGAAEQQEQVDGRGTKEEESELLGLMLRLMAGNRKKAPQELALEGFISLVHLMWRVLIPGGGTERRRRASRDASLFRFIVNRPQVAHLLTQMLDPDLIDHILEESDQRLKHLPRGDVDCIRVLTCKAKPFVGGMQRALRFFVDRDDPSSEGVAGEGASRQNEAEAAWEGAGPVDRMYFFMPTLGEVVEHGRRCDHLFPDCLY